MDCRPLPPAIATALCVLILSVTSWLWLRSQDDNSSEISAEPFGAQPPEGAPSETLEPVIDPLGKTRRGTASPSHSIANEQILSFSNQTDYRRFLARALNGIEVLAQNDTLRSLRIRTTADIDLQTLAPNAQSDNNFTLLPPMPIATDTLVQDKAFGGGAMTFMNAVQNSSAAGQGVKIAVLDTGIRNHSTFNTVKLTQISTASSQDYLSHGTAVASLIAGQDGIGIAPKADLISIQVLDSDGLGDVYSLSTAIVQAVDAGANIINMSLGSYGTNQALANAISYANSQGVVLVASAGNESAATLPYPAAYDSVITVAAIDAEGHPTSFSNQSDSIDLAAPGVGVYAAWEEEKWISFTGTSASAPYVSGAIAVISSELDISVEKAAQILIANANDSGLPGADRHLGLGYIDLQRSLASNTSYTDLALADIYLAPNPNEDEPHTLYLTAQNRGTESIPTASLSYTLPNGITQEIYLGALEPGQSASHMLTLGSSELEEGYPISAAVSLGRTSSDQKVENNTLQAILHPIKPRPSP
ncbi:S8 family serine peptidase [Pelagicoccus sp. SDUM812002]|uniref:S8 family serine peptidase n=1 Tax=Pelagicoccus sp. SDUM812002 TaxID=3041266 RepID=UPI00280F2AF0|nr:S8 family serine peptidase [Pelagicoccus sp. SDUM812002]MDQ8184777.1 S8 family serine peptidase [Pelagicoccus sp. SDUM812002]